MEDSSGLRVILLGNSGVGKTSFVNASHQVPIDKIKSSTGMSFSTYEYFDTGITLNIWDTAGQEVYHSLVTAYFRGSQIVIFFTACNDPNEPKAEEKNKKDDEELTFWIKQAYSCLDDTFTPVFVLNKIDFYKDDAETLQKRQDEVRDKIIQQLRDISENSLKHENLLKLEDSLEIFSISCINRTGISDLIELLGNIAEKIQNDPEKRKNVPKGEDLTPDSQTANAQKCKC